MCILGLSQVAVHVPFQIRNGIARQQGAEFFKQILADLRAGNIQHQLVAPQLRGSTHALQRPIGVLAVQLAVRVHHFGLHPQTKAHAQTQYMGNQRGQALRVFDGVWPPVTQSTAVIGATREPTIIQYKTLNPQGSRLHSQFAQGGVVVIEINRFPRIQMHGAGRHTAMGPAQHMAAGKRMEVAGSAVQALLGPRHMQCRGLDAVPCCQSDFTGGEPLTGLQQEAAVVVAIQHKRMVAAPRQLGSDHLALCVIGLRRHQKTSWGGLV